MRIWFNLITVVLILHWIIPATEAGMGPLKVHPQNPRYFADSDGKLVYLTGSHTWADFQERGIEGTTPDFDYAAFLKFITDNNHNFVRLWVWEQSVWLPSLAKDKRIRFKPLCYLRTGPGKAIDGEPKFDVTQFNPDYFERLRSRVFDAREKGIYVGVMLFQGYSVGQKGKKEVDPQLGNPWDGHPFHSKNNINNINGDANNDGEGEEIHTLGNPPITKLQEAYVKKVIDTLNGFDNLIWEIGNECGGASVDWQKHFVQFIKDYETKLPFQHPVWMSYRETAPNSEMLQSPADAISPNGEDGYKDNPPAAQGNKIIIADTDHIDPQLKTIDSTWVWKSFLRGLNPIVIDPYRDVCVDSPAEPVKGFELMRKAMEQTRLYSKMIDLTKMTPHNECSSTNYCLANPGEEYLAYQPQSEKLFWVDLPPGSYQVDLFSPQEERIKTSMGLQSDEQKKQLIPIFFYGDVVVHVKKAVPEAPAQNANESVKEESGKKEEPQKEEGKKEEVKPKKKKRR